MTLEHRYRAIVEYDGTDFLGFQIQKKGRTVQGEIENSLKKVTQAKLRISAAGRTDAGVHAIGQVIAFDLAWTHALSELQRALNATLPYDIVISDLKIVDKAFNPRFRALSRSYRYTILNQPWPSALQRRYSYHLKEQLDVAAMNQASQILLGEHDFASFGKPTQGESTVRTIMHIGWSEDGKQLHFKITANAFLYRMVRRIVGTLIQIGLGQILVDEVQQILEARDLKRSAPPAPAQGLCLLRVTYPE